jgi:hypothetical protein
MHGVVASPGLNAPTSTTNTSPMNMGSCGDSAAGSANAIGTGGLGEGNTLAVTWSAI